MGALRKLWLRFGWQRPVTWSFRHFLSQARLAKDVNTALKHVTYLTRKHSLRPTGESSNSHTSTLISSSSITPGKATGSVSDWTHVWSLARRKSKWTMGGCGALPRCGCARMYEGTQFLCMKFRLGSAGEPTICSHCYDVLNEGWPFCLGFNVVNRTQQWLPGWHPILSLTANSSKLYSPYSRRVPLPLVRIPQPLIIIVPESNKSFCSPSWPSFNNDFTQIKAWISYTIHESM